MSILNVGENKLRNYKKLLRLRQLSVYEADDAVYDFWGVLVMTFEHKFEVNKTNEAKGILKKINSFNFSTVAMLCDVLSVITKLSKVFQKENQIQGK